MNLRKQTIDDMATLRASASSSAPISTSRWTIRSKSPTTPASARPCRPSIESSTTAPKSFSVRTLAARRASSTPNTAWLRLPNGWAGSWART